MFLYGVYYSQAGQTTGRWSLTSETSQDSLDKPSALLLMKGRSNEKAVFHCVSIAQCLLDHNWPWFDDATTMALDIV